MASVSGFANAFKLWIAYPIHTSGLSRIEFYFLRFLRSEFIHWVFVLPFILLRTSPIGRTPGFLSRGIRRHELYAIRFSWGTTLLAVVRITIGSNHDFKGFHMIYLEIQSDDFLWHLILRGSQKKEN